MKEANRKSNSTDERFPLLSIFKQHFKHLPLSINAKNQIVYGQMD